LIDNVKDFGFSWEVVPEEPWHLRYVAGDDVPAAVAAFTGEEVSTVPAPAAAAAKEETPAPVAVSASKPAPANDDADSLDIGSRGPKVRQLQQALKAKSIYQGPVDGEYGPLLAAAVKKFKVANKLAADGKAGGKVFKLLGI
jgi:peptidoglycan hydrolase-like protein with peptidoglycan-binding domain